MLGGRPTGLGKGLGAIIPPKPVSSTSGMISASPEREEFASSSRPDQGVHELPVGMIDPNPHQPREHFDHQDLEDLVLSIREHGVLQPVVVTPKPDGRYELIAGERRLRASKIAECEMIPVLVRTATEQQKLELAIIENVQRANLNPLEEARAYLRLQNEFQLTQDEISSRVGKSRPQVANTIRLLQLPEQIQDGLSLGKISTSNARTLLSLPTDDERIRMYQSLLDHQFTVRQTESRMPRTRARAGATDPNVAHAEDELRGVLGARVSIKRAMDGKGEIRISFQNDEDFSGLIRRITRKDLL